MKSLYIFILLSLGAVSAAWADGGGCLPCGAVIEGVEMNRLRDSVVVTMSFDLSQMEVGSNHSVVLAPVLRAGSEIRELPAVEVMGRRRHLYYRRNLGAGYVSAPYRVVKREAGHEQRIDYRVSLLYAQWMDNVSLVVGEDVCGCGEVLSQAEGLSSLASARLAIVPALAYQTPAVEEVKERALSGEAYLDFPVNKTDIRPGYRRNTTELARIRATIDTIRSDQNYTIRSISLRGYASPEGDLAWNIKLSESRTEALRRYLIGQCAIEPRLLRTEAAAENWSGLRQYVSQSSLPDKDAILVIIDSPEEPDSKEARLRTEHPESYALLLAECYPGLRRTDYRIDYVVRGFSVDEARQMLAIRPQNLSLQEMFAVAQTYEPGSPEFNHVFDVAARLYPADPVANLNAANALLESGQAEAAQPFLQKAGTSPQADNARGVAHLMLQQYDEAETCLRRAAESGLPEACANLKYVAKE